MVSSRIHALAILAWSVCCASAQGDALLLEFTAPTCGPCRRMRPVMEQLHAAGQAIREVDVSRERELAREYRVTSCPTFIVVVDGREWARLEGATTQAELVGMIQKATALAAADAAAAPRRDAGAGVNTLVASRSQPHGGGGGAATTFAAGPSEGRIVQIQDPYAAPRSAQPQPAAPANPAAAPGARAGVSGATASPLEAACLAASVRLSIEDPDGKSTGSGVIVDARGGEALVLTCGHLFRASGGKGAISLTLFAAGPAGAQAVGSADGVLVNYDLDRDLALVRFRPPGAVATAPIAPHGTSLTPGAAATSVGCNGGADPTAWPTRITALNRYQGHPNIEAEGAPVEGRSGGGLFNDAGEVIGICFAADPRGDEGLYASLDSIHQKLDELQLSVVYESPARGDGMRAATDAPLVAAAAAAGPDQPFAEPAEAAPFAVRGQDPAAAAPPSNWPTAAPSPEPRQQFATAPPMEAPPMTAAPFSPAPAPATATAAALTPAEQATLQELARRGANAEIICIIRPHTADGRSEVIKLQSASPAFVAALAAAARDARGPATDNQPLMR